VNRFYILRLKKNKCRGTKRRKGKGKNKIVKEIKLRYKIYGFERRKLECQ
jgi:hypothetical protein